MTTDRQARQYILQAWPLVFSEPPTLPELQAVQAVGREETGYGNWVATNNWGAIQSGRPDDSGNCPPGSVFHGDTHENGQAYGACFATYATPADGARALIHAVFVGAPGTARDRAPVRAAAKAGDQIAFDTALRKSGYYELPLAQHIKATTANVAAIAKSLGEPIALSLNPAKSSTGKILVGMLVAVAGALGYRKWKRSRAA